MNIKIIGSNCSNGIKLRKNLLKALNSYEDKVQIELKDDKDTQNKYNIKNIPGLVINGNICTQGCVPSEKEIMKYIKKYTKLESIAS